VLLEVSIPMLYIIPAPQRLTRISRKEGMSAKSHAVIEVTQASPQVDADGRL
jgi:hypothetical protein